MNSTESALVVLIGGEDVKHVFPTWPNDICLAACLMRDGDCSMVVFRRDERPRIPARLVQTLGLAAREVCFVPEVYGYPTKQFFYSDERRLMALVGSDPAILEEAVDYAVNYTYALEEGLDPDVLLGLPSQDHPTSQTPPADPVPQAAFQRRYRGQSAKQEKELSPLLPDFLRRSAENARRPRFASVRRSGLAALLPQV